MVNASSESSTKAQAGANLPLIKATSYYDILNVSPIASATTIKDAYHTLIKQHHPDKQRNHHGTVNDVSEQYHSDTNGSIDIDFLQVQTAWECLRDPKSRSIYDKQIQHTLQEHKVRRRQRQQNSIPITIEECRQERQLIETDESDDFDSIHVSHNEIRREVVTIVDYIYQCRCGHDVYVAQQQQPLNDESSKPVTEPSHLLLIPYNSACEWNEKNSHDYDDMFVHCVGCSVIYDIRPVFRNVPNDGTISGSS